MTPETQGRSFSWIRKSVVISALVSSLLTAIVLGSFWGVFKKQGLDKKMGSLAAQHAELQSSYDDLKKKFNNLEADRNNVLAQIRNLLGEKSKWTELEESFKDLEEMNSRYSDQKNKLHKENDKIKSELATLKIELNRLKDSYGVLQSEYGLAARENGQMKASLVQKVESAPQFQKLDKEFKSVKSDNKKLNDTIKQLDEKLKKALDRIKKIQDRDIKFSRQIGIYRHQVEVLSSDKNSLIQTNRRLNEMVVDAPRRFGEMSQENKRLVKETASMHYNLGVFYSQNREYTLALKEFLRALDFNPNDPKVHYNLGTMYSEQFEKHDEALAHFRKFLQISPKGKESESVRSYVLMRETYGNKAPAK